MDELLISNRPLLYLRGFERTKRLVLGLSEHFRDTYYCRSPHSSHREGTALMFSAFTDEEIHCFLPDSPT